jgi:hypothetical protein
MKKIFKIAIIFCVMALYSCDCEEHKYRIIANGDVYFTNNYTKEAGCIKFTNYDNDKLTICGNYSIVETISSQ